MGKRSRPGNDDLSSQEHTPRISQRQVERIDSTADSDEVGTSDIQDTQDDLPRKNLDNELYMTPSDAKRRRLECVLVQGPACPLSAYLWEGQPAERLERGNEARSIEALKSTHELLHAEDAVKPEYTYFRLDDFRIYRPQGRTASDRHGGEMVTLDRLLKHRDGCTDYLLDGTLSCGSRECKVRGVAFRVLTIDGYGDHAFSVSDSICIQSTAARRADVWYQLGKPAMEYARFYRPFLWLAHFTKCFIEYMMDHKQVTLHHFARDASFAHWLEETYGGSAEYQDWCAESNLLEYRTTVAANVGFLHKEAYSIDKRLCKQPVWGEVDPINLTAIPAEPNMQQRTVVTPFAHDMFRHMYFASQLKSTLISDPKVLAEVRERKRQMGLTPLSSSEMASCTAKVTSSSTSEPPTTFSRGDVVTVKADYESKWKTKEDIWYAYVQRVRITDTGSVQLDVLWLYHPGDTTLGAAYYPFANELFLSDNCGCGSHALSPEDIISKVEVKWGSADPGAEAGLFIRQKFCTVAEEDRYSFETVKDSDFRCDCDQIIDNNDQTIDDWKKCLRQYELHDTVLVLRFKLTASHSIRIRGDVYHPGDEILARLSDENIANLDGSIRGWLDPAEIVEFDYEQQTIRVRPFVRRAMDDSSCKVAPNELICGEHTLQLPTSRLARKCHVRVVEKVEIQENRIPAPYDRGGAADCYFLSSKTMEGQDAATLNFKRGFDPTAPNRKLRGMGIFCGGGNLDRGLEDSGVAEFDYAVDWAEHALHSYRAASQNPMAHYFLGSVDDYLAAALAGSTKSNIARVGAVELFAAGSPCPGFSALNGNKMSEQSLKNASMVASVVAHVDFYSPQYFVLENVVAMTQGMGANKNENVFSQVLAALVALGYQVQQFLMDAWSYGSCQQRSRVFIVASAPGLQPLSAPAHTHDHPNSTPYMERSLGRSTNGLPFGKRRNEFTPFPHVSLSAVCRDLPFIGDAQTRLCTTFPGSKYQPFLLSALTSIDHRTPSDESGTSRTRVAMVPVRPEGMGLVQAVRAGYITGGEPYEFFTKLGHSRLTKSSTTYARLNPDGLIPTLTTALRICDGVAGRTLHWAEQRSISVMECRRAQGYRDGEVLVGTTFQQMKIIGNSVDRMVSLALGMALKTSWEHGEGGEQFPSTHTEHQQLASRLAASPVLVSEQLVSLFTPPLTPPRIAAGTETGTVPTNLERGFPQYRHDRDVLHNSDQTSLHSEDQDIDVAPVEVEDAENSSARVLNRNSTEVHPSRPHAVVVIRRSQQSQASSTRDLINSASHSSAVPDERKVRFQIIPVESLDRARSVNDAHKHRVSRSDKPRESTQDHADSMATVTITEDAPRRHTHPAGLPVPSDSVPASTAGSEDGLPASPPLTPPEFESQDAPLKLSDAQVQEIRTDGFKAILRMLDSSPRR
ncbi:hypothetical protein LTR17_022090 [Elasticomyces elasticus]|nr:hypothetical protein LTR17_022090 [Elasticomyces elasticus]